MDFRHVESAFKDIWGDKKPEVVQQNVAAAKLGGDAVKDMGGPLPLGLAYPNQAKYLMTGNEAVCLGALAAGVKFLAQYPSAPAKETGPARSWPRGIRRNVSPSPRRRSTWRRSTRPPLS